MLTDKIRTEADVHEYIDWYVMASVEPEDVAAAKARVMPSVKRQMRRNGLPRASTLQHTVENALETFLYEGDGMYSFQNNGPALKRGYSDQRKGFSHDEYHNPTSSIDRVLSSDPDENFTQKNLLFAEPTSGDAYADFIKAQTLLTQLRSQIPPEQFALLLSFYGGKIDLLAHSLFKNGGDFDVENFPNPAQLTERIASTQGWSPETALLYSKYVEFQEGNRFSNPFCSLTHKSIPPLSTIITREYENEAFSGNIRERLVKLGFRTLLERSGGIAEVIRLTNENLLHTIPNLQLSKLGKDKARETVLDKIAKTLYIIPGYEEAEKKGRNEQVSVLTEFISDKRLNLQKYFHQNGLMSLMQNYHDKEGEYGFTKKDSPLAVLEFYSKHRKFYWFDTTNKHFIPKHLIRQNAMWSEGQESEDLAIEAIDYTLHTLSGYEEVEKSEDRIKQIMFIYEASKEGSLSKVKLQEKGLGGMMQQFYDETGEKRYGLKKKNSPSSVLEFYSEHKNLGWFDETNLVYLKVNKRGRIELADNMSELFKNQTLMTAYVLFRNPKSGINFNMYNDIPLV